MKPLNRWKLSELSEIKNGLTCFSAFSCGGGSSMGYKLAGFDCLGGVEIDPRMASVYRENLKPKYLFVESVDDFLKRETLPPDLHDLDVLDGSPPCSSFSMAGNREKDWGKKKKFAEGQVEQVLDDLFFKFIELANRLRPKIVVAENVKGLIQGNAKGYVKWIFEKLEAAGYETQLFLLDSSKMGVPQKRERTFFIARRKDLALPPIEFSFNEKPIPAGIAIEGANGNGKPLKEPNLGYWKLTPRGKSLAFAHPRGSLFSWVKISPLKPAPTLTATPVALHWNEPRYLSDEEVQILQTFPDDYNFGIEKVAYICGMSVPPVMMKNIAATLAKLLLAKKTCTSD